MSSTSKTLPLALYHACNYVFLMVCLHILGPTYIVCVNMYLKHFSIPAKPSTPPGCNECYYKINCLFDLFHVELWTTWTGLVFVCVAVQYSSTIFSISFLKALNMAVGLQAGEEDVEEPQTQEQQAGQDPGHPRTAELSADGGPASEQKHSHADESEDGEECDGEGQ